MFDSNIRLKLILDETNSKEARIYVTNSLKKGHALRTTDIAFAECLNVI